MLKAKVMLSLKEQLMLYIDIPYRLTSKNSKPVSRLTSRQNFSNRNQYVRKPVKVHILMRIEEQDFFSTPSIQ